MTSIRPCGMKYPLLLVMKAGALLQLQKALPFNAFCSLKKGCTPNESVRVRALTSTLIISLVDSLLSKILFYFCSLKRRFTHGQNTGMLRFLSVITRLHLSICFPSEGGALYSSNITLYGLNGQKHFLQFPTC
jgi:hypothetical protein